VLNCNWIFPVILLTTLAACKPITQEPLQRWQQSTQGAYAGQISSDAKFSVVSSIHHGLSVWDLSKNERIYSWAQEQNTSDNLVLSIDISDNASHVLTANRDNFALWNLQSGKSEGYWKVRESHIRDIAISNGGDYLLIGKSNGTVVHVAVDTGRRLEFLGHKEKINSVDMLPNGRVAISGGNDFTAYVWGTQSGQVVYQFNHSSRVSKVALDAKGRYAFSADSMKGAYIWNLKTGKRISSLQGTKRHEVFSTVRFSPDGKTLITGAATRKVSVWDIATGKRLSHWFVTPKEAKRPTGAVVYSVAFGDNNNLLTISSSGYVESWPITK
jgi:WD40 repeat protein